MPYKVGMRNARVPLFGNVAKSVTIDPAATDGATFGVNLRWPDGRLVQAGDFTTSAPAGSGAISTTDDLDEGQWNLWFTPRRAQDAVGGILADSANVTLRYAPGASITADLTDLTDSGAGALLAITRDGKGRITGTRAATITGTAGRVTVAHGDASDGLPTIDLATVPDAGGGTLQRTTFDDRGRKTGTSAATTTDLPEGDNLYFTAARVRATLLAGLSLASNAVITAADTVISALGKLQAQITDNLLPAGYIDGLKMVWVSGTALTVTTGAAYIPGLGKVLRATSDIAKTGLALTASTWYHVYLYSNAGTPAIECVTTDPDAPYNGTARAKTGDTSRRYLGSILTDASGNIFRFQQNGNEIQYVVNMVAPFRVLSGGKAVIRTTVDFSSVIPITADYCIANVINNDSIQLFVDLPELGNSGYITRYTCLSNQRTPIITALPSRTFQYFYLLTPTSSGAFMDAWGYRFSR